MINYCIDGLKEAIMYLDTRYSDKHVTLHLLEDHDSVQGPDGQVGFAAYVPETKDIYLALNIPEPEKNVIINLGHEFYHFLQDLNNKEFNEEEAQQFGIHLYMKVSIV